MIGANGVYGNSSGTFPTNSWNDSNYFVDVVVGGDDTPPPTTPPTVTDTTPAAGATDVAVGRVAHGDLLAGHGPGDHQRDLGHAPPAGGRHRR